MALKDEWTLLCENAKHDAKELYDKAKLHPLISLFFIFSVVLLVAVPHYQVSEINNATERVTQENQARTSLAQIFGGAALGIGLYYTWRRINIAEADLKFTKENLEITKEIAKDNLKVAQEGQITERYTRAVNQLGASDQLGNPAIEIRLGGIYALERIANESEKDYWSIMEILTAYIRKNTSTKDIKVWDVENQNNVAFDIQAILTVIGICKNSLHDYGSNSLNLRMTHLEGADLSDAHLEWAQLEGADLNNAHLERANLSYANLERSTLHHANLKGANLIRVNLEGADLKDAHLERTVPYISEITYYQFKGAESYKDCLEATYLRYANLEGANLRGANLEGADLNNVNFIRANLEGANLKDAYFAEADLSYAHLKEAKNLIINQLSEVKTLYKADLDENLSRPLKETPPGLFIEP